VRTVWHKEVIDTKTEHRAARVHLLPNVIAELKKQRKQNPGTTRVFEGPHVCPLDLATLGSKIIKKTLQGTGVEWHGFHAFRRGLGNAVVQQRDANRNRCPDSPSRLGFRSDVEILREVEEETKAAALQSLPRKIKKARRNQILLTSASHSGRKTV